MTQKKQAPISRQAFQEWLEDKIESVLTLQKGTKMATVVKVPVVPEIDYLFGCETVYGGDISWHDRFEFCGLYDRHPQSLYLLENPLPDYVSGLTEEECQDSTILGKRIAQEINRYVEAAIDNDRRSLSIKKLTSEPHISRTQYYKENEAKQDAVRLVFSGEKPDEQFHGGYGIENLKENELLSYLKNPEGYIRDAAEQYMKENQENFLVQFLERDALLAEYQALTQDSDGPVYRMRAITEAIERSGAKSVHVTVEKEGVELTFKTSAASLKGLRSYYSIYDIAPSDRVQFKNLFGASADYTVEDIVRITYGKSTLYEAPPIFAEDIGMQGINLQ